MLVGRVYRAHVEEVDECADRCQDYTQDVYLLARAVVANHLRLAL